MPNDYQSKFTGKEIDSALQKSIDTAPAQKVNEAVADIATAKTNIAQNTQKINAMQKQIDTLPTGGGTGGGGTPAPDLSIYLKKDLADIDLQKLYDKGLDAKLTDNELSNVDPAVIGSKFSRSAVYRAIENQFPTKTGVQAKFIETQQPLNANAFARTSEDIIHVVFQLMTDGQIFIQELPPASINKVLILETVFSQNVNTGTVRINPQQGEQFDGKTIATDFTQNGVLGYCFAQTGGWGFIPYSAVHDIGIAVTSDTEAYVGATGLKITGATISSNDGGKTVEVNIPAASGVVMTDKSGADFTPSKIKAPFKDIEITNNNGVAELMISPEVLAQDHAEGIFYKLAEDTQIAGGRKDLKLYFDEHRVNGKTYVYGEQETKSIILQEVDGGDPNITGGTLFKLGFSFEPITETAPVDCFVELAVRNVLTNDILLDVNGNPIAVRRSYKAGDRIERELLIGQYRAKGAVKAGFEIDTDLTGDVIEVSHNTCIVAQATTKNKIDGLAWLAFQHYVGIIIREQNLYFGDNFFSLAFGQADNVAKQTVQAGSQIQGNRMFISVATTADVEVKNRKLVITDTPNGALPVFTLGRLFTPLESLLLRGKTVEVLTTIANPDQAVIISLLKHDGISEDFPQVTAYSNTQPVFSNGWVEVAKTQINENSSGQEATYAHTFTLPDSGTFAIILRQVDAQTPLNLTVADFAGNIAPAFMESIITDNANINEDMFTFKHNKYIFSAKTPGGYSALRYTINASEVKLPVGTLQVGGSGIANDRSWNTPNTNWDVEGDLLFKNNGTVSMYIEVQAYTGESVQAGGQSNNSLWLAKNNGDGTFTKVAGSQVDFIQQGSNRMLHRVQTPNFVFNVKQGEKYRIFAVSDVADGAYLQSGLDGKPLLTAYIDFMEETATAKPNLFEGVEIIEKGKQVAGKLQFDVDTEKWSVIKNA